MLKSNELETRKCVENNKNLFEDVAKGYINTKDIYRVQYSILNYGKIIDQMIEFIDGYKSYADTDDKKYDGKVLSISRNFYDRMFTDKDNYRMKINLEQFKDINKEYLIKTKQLQSLIESYLADKNMTSEMNALITLTNNQYKKLSRVMKDDMKIYLWLSTSNSKLFAYSIDNATRSEFSNNNSPVMHKAPKK
jgi:hypothetical protein